VRPAFGYWPVDQVETVRSYSSGVSASRPSAMERRELLAQRDDLVFEAVGDAGR
jgi:hypothetical protein